MFADDLAGHPLLTNNYVRWINFLLVKNVRWRAEVRPDGAHEPPPPAERTARASRLRSREAASRATSRSRGSANDPSARRQTASLTEPVHKSRDGGRLTSRLVLLGDALHTAHFSIGSGTKLALEDAIALAAGFSRHNDVDDALADFEAARRPIVDALQEAARESQIWFENVAALTSMAPVPFAYALMTRSGKIDHERLRRRDPAFVSQYEAWARNA